MAHIGEEELAVYAASPDAIGAARRAEIEREIASCAECRTTFELMAVADDDLPDSDVWERSTGSASLDSLRAHGKRVAAEDEEAAALLEPYLRAPAQAAWQSFHAKRYRTGGVVRKLIAHAATLHEREPLEALTFADTAIMIAEALPDDSYTANAVYELRGTAWKERANALRFLGRYDEGLESLRRAERAYRALTWPAFGLASVAYVRASILFEQQLYGEASEAASIAEQAFSALGDEEREMRAVNMRANIAFERGDTETAIYLFRRVADHGEQRNDALWMARGAQALGNCYLEARRPSEASVQLHTALLLFRELDQGTEITRTEWGVARLIMDGGKLDEAIRRLRAVITGFASAGMVTDAALAGLDLAEAFLAVGQVREIVALTRHLFRVFTDAGMLTGALTAIAYLKEAAESGQLTKADIEVVRGFLRRAERQPGLLFVVPPRTFS
jgi:tetratricopeptide (TPR) repeat protein